jgi:predicted CoA-binding protein
MIRTLVLGASLNRTRYAHLAIRRLQRQNFWVVGIGSRAGRVGGTSIYNEKILLKNIHTVSVYLNPKNQEEYYKYVVELNPVRVIFNPGSENPRFETLLSHHKIPFERSCTLVLISTGQF